MGILDFFRRRTVQPSSLLESLLDAVEKKDMQRVADLCNENRQEIHDSFGTWNPIPEHVRSNRSAMQRYANGLIAIAQIFEQTGDGTLMAVLSPPDEANPMVQWVSDLRAAQALMDASKYGEAAEFLDAMLVKYGKLVGSGADYYLPRTYGLIGLAYFRLSDREKAIEFTYKAKTACEAAQDQEGVETYTRNLQMLREGV